MRIPDHNSAGKTIAASTVVTFTSSDVPSTQIVAYHLTTTGANNSFAAIDRIRVKANGVAIYDLTTQFLRAYIQRMTANSVCYPAATALDNLGVAGTAVGFRRFTIPFMDLTRFDEDSQDLQAFPPASNVTIEVTFNGTASAGLLFCGWTETTVPTMRYPRLLASQASIAASQATGRYNISDDGIIVGMGLNTLGLLRAKLVLAKEQVFHTLGQNASSATVTADSMFNEVQQLNNAISTMQAATAGVPTVLTDPVFVRAGGKSAPAGSSFVELQTGANWAGVTNEVLLASYVDLVPPSGR